jgi:hypothetical protein
MIHVCGWCRPFLGVKPPFSEWAVTHGICVACQTRLLADHGAEPPACPTPRNLLILTRRAPPLAAHLALPVPAYGEPTLVLWDRRANDRHETPSGLEPERRRGDRRAPGSGPVTGGGLLVRPAVRQPDRPTVTEHLTADLARSS